MLQFLYDYGLFLAKTATLVLALVILFGVLMRSRQHRGSEPPGHVEVRNLSEEYEDLTEDMYAEVLDLDAYKARHKEEEKRAKEEEKARKQKKDGEEEKRKPRLFVLNFLGDLEASSVHCLREEITAVLTIAEADAGDEVLLRLESPGGLVHSYGHAASQLQRLRDARLKLTIAVDEVAASGGYMMACVADQIIAAPFAVIGSIGVIAELPNFNRLMKRFDVDYELHTAGQFKRTLTVFGENTDEGREKFQQELEDTHLLFKQFVRNNRPQLDIEKVATGEHWYGMQAKDLGLVDALQTSDAYLQQSYDSHDVYELNYEFRRTLADRLAISIRTQTDRLLMHWFQRFSNRHFFTR